MAKVKRPAEKNLISNKPKRPRTTDSNLSNEHSILTSEDSSAETVDSPSQDPVFDDLVNRLTTFRGQATNWDRWAKGFAERVEARQTNILGMIDDAQQKIERDNDQFQENMLTILTSLLTGSNPAPAEDAEPLPILELQAPTKTPAMQSADTLVANCSTLVSAYQSLCTTDTAQSNATLKMRETFTQDKAETTRAFEASRKSICNKLQGRFAEKMGGVQQERFVLDEVEERLAKRGLGTGKTGGCGEDDIYMDGQGIGSLLYGFRKVVAKMSALVE